MYLRHLGYACQNLTLERTTGRTLRLASLEAERVRALVEENIAALLDILRWNVEHDIRFFRVSSDVVPFASHERFPLDAEAAFGDALREVRAFVEAEGVRLSMHPGQYTVLNSPRPEVVDAAIAELEYQAWFVHSVDPAQGTLTLHVGGAYGDKEAAIERFTANFARLSPRAQRVLALENDDKTYAAHEVLPLCERLGLPMIFDYFHHRCLHAGRTPDEDAVSIVERAAATWGGRVPKLHLSSRKDGTKTSHADFIEPDDLKHFLGIMENAGEHAPFDLMLEAKQKDCALLRLQPVLSEREGSQGT